jgi:hypothetical protein
VKRIGDETAVTTGYYLAAFQAAKLNLALGNKKNNSSQP